MPQQKRSGVSTSQAPMNEDTVSSYRETSSDAYRQPHGTNRLDQCRADADAKYGSVEESKTSGLEAPGEETSFTNLLRDATHGTMPSSSSSSPSYSNANASSECKSKQNESVANETSRGDTNSKENVQKMTVRAWKDGDKLGFGVCHDPQHRLVVSTMHTSSTNSPLRIGDRLLSMNGQSLMQSGFLEAIQKLKTAPPGELEFEIERDPTLELNESNFPFNTSESMNVDGTGEVEAMQPPSSGAMVAPDAPAVGSGKRPTPNKKRSCPTSNAQPPSSMTGTSMEPARKTARPNMDVVTDGDATHKQVVNALVLELKKERSDRETLADRNASLRKRLQQALIQCDEIRAATNEELSRAHEQSKRVTDELEQALAHARAQLRMQDQAPSVSRTDTVMTKLAERQMQLDRYKRYEKERKMHMNNRFALESRLAEREAHRVRERLITMLRTQLRQLANGQYPRGGSDDGRRGRQGGRDLPPGFLSVTQEGVRRLAFLKLFGLPCDVTHYSSNDFLHSELVRHAIGGEEFTHLFGTSLCVEERAGHYFVGTSPMDIIFEPSTESLTLICSWVEENAVRDMGRNMRF